MTRDLSSHLYLWSSMTRHVNFISALHTWILLRRDFFGFESLLLCLWLGIKVKVTFQSHISRLCYVCAMTLTGETYRKVFNISRTLIGNKIVDHSDVAGASPVGAAPTTSSLSTWHLASMDWAMTTARRDEKHLCLGIWCTLYLTVHSCDLKYGRNIILNHGGLVMPSGNINLGQNWVR